MSKKILIVDDDALVLKSVGRLLGEKGYEVSQAKSANEALGILNSQSFDVILTDIRMPGQNGLELIREIRKKQGRPGKGGALLVFTGYASEECPIDAIKLEVDDYILKPFDNDHLLSAIDKALQRNFSKNFSVDSLEKSCDEMKKAISEFSKIHEKEIFDNSDLREFITIMEGALQKMEMELVKLIK